MRATSHPVAGTTADARTGPPVRADELTAVPVRHWGRWAAAAAALLSLAGLVGSLAKNPNLHWDVVGHYLAADLVFDGLTTTLWLTVAAMAIGLGLGTLVAVLRL